MSQCNEFLVHIKFMKLTFSVISFNVYRTYICVNCMYPNCLFCCLYFFKYETERKSFDGKTIEISKQIYVLKSPP